MSCPAEKTTCPCLEYSKDGLCDWPYKVGMTLEEIRQTTQQKMRGDSANDKNAK